MPYFHLVFTLPDALNPIALGNPRVVYDLLLRCAAETVLEVAANPEHLGARTGVLAVLHTWGQALQFHPARPLRGAGRRLVAGSDVLGRLRPDFFLPVRVLSRVFRGKFLAGLRAAYTRRPTPPDGPVPRRRGGGVRARWSRPRSAPTGWCMPSRRSAAPRWC